MNEAQVRYRYSTVPVILESSRIPYHAVSSYINNIIPQVPKQAIIMHTKFCPKVLSCVICSTTMGGGEISLKCHSRVSPGPWQKTMLAKRIPDPHELDFQLNATGIGRFNFDPRELGLLPRQLETVQFQAPPPPIEQHNQPKCNNLENHTIVLCSSTLPTPPLE
jgi:hypothetical protein